MKPIESTLRKLSALYEFNRRLRAFTVGKTTVKVNQALELRTRSNTSNEDHRQGFIPPS